MTWVCITSAGKRKRRERWLAHNAGRALTKLETDWPTLHLRFPLKTGAESSLSSLLRLPSNRAAEAVYKELGFAYWHWRSRSERSCKFVDTAGRWEDPLCLVGKSEKREWRCHKNAIKSRQWLRTQQLWPRLAGFLCLRATCRASEKYLRGTKCRLGWSPMLSSLHLWSQETGSERYIKHQIYEWRKSFEYRDF